MNKVTMQDIADALGISRVTVWKVFNNYANVSASLRTEVLAKARELGYSKGLSEMEEVESEKNVSLIVSRPNSSTFWTNIIHRMAQELSLHNINLMYTYMPSKYSEKFRMPQVLLNNTVQGAIVLNVYDKTLVEEINELDIPKVFLDIVPQIDLDTLKGDLVLLEGHNCCYQITRSLLERGYTDIGFIGDIHYARTNLERYEGFRQCMKDNRLPVKERNCLTRRIGILSYEKEIGIFLNSLQELPEAFVCASDFIAHFVQLYFAAHPERIPGGMPVTGFDGSSEYSNVDGIITTADVKTGLLGKRLSMQIVYRMEHADAPYEQTYIKPSIIYRDSILYGKGGEISIEESDVQFAGKSGMDAGFRKDVSLERPVITGRRL